MIDAASDREATLAAHIAELQDARLADRETIENLQIGLLSARRIGAAIGIVMATHRATYDQAFDLLVSQSQRTNHKLREIAEDVILTGQLR